MYRLRCKYTLYKKSLKEGGTLLKIATWSENNPEIMNKKEISLQLKYHFIVH